ncbi:glycoside hydrolase family 172 protein [Actinomycetospora sp. OC33-EN08]|uniref:Glycoside hydrolase family 172 protein n=1 Tax=Actinomycetospora aurantiaca TaxID=3129233 RepID=A0ABU8MNF7_9PSEU
MTAAYGPHGSSLRDLPRLRRTRRRRESTWDRTGGNDDRAHVRPGESVTLLDVDGAGVVTHLWITVNGPRRRRAELLRRLTIRMWWDGEESPSVAAPLGDFFGVGHGRTTNFVSAPLQMSPQDGRALNCWFAMPFADGARIEVSNEAPGEVWLYAYVDHEELDTLDAEVGRFHAQFRRERTTGIRPGLSNGRYQFGGKNLTGDGNYTILEARGHGHYVGCVLNVRPRRRRRWNWYGEGDDMIFVDQEPGDWPPTLHGTGTEDYVNTAWCPTQAYSAPYHGLTLPGGRNWRGPVSLYRFHVEDPVVFERSIRVTIEHGHANRRSDDWSSVAYWYQAEPHVPFELPPLAERLP